MNISFDWVKASKNHSVRSGVGVDSFKINKVKGGRGQKSGEPTVYAAAVIIPIGAMKQARFVIGDRVELGFAISDEKGRMVAVRRVPEGGYRLGPASNPTKAVGKNGAASSGEVARARVQLTWRDSIHEGFSSDNGGYEVTDDGLLVAWEGVK